MIKGAPYVPTRGERVEKMIVLSGLKAGETMMDFGSGDGRIVFAAAKTGAQCIGVEINPLLYWRSEYRRRAMQLKNAQFLRKDLWTIDLRGVDVLTLYFISHKMEKLKEKIVREMRPGARVVSHGFTFPDWQSEAKDDTVYLYLVQK